MSLPFIPLTGTLGQLKLWPQTVAGQIDNDVAAFSGGVKGRRAAAKGEDSK